jgi:hypothetical protein
VKWARNTVAIAVVVCAAIATAIKFGDWESRRLSARVNELEQEKTRLADYARRLSASRRVAQVDVVRQRVDANGRTVSTLLWQEIGTDGTRGKPVAVEAVGKLVYFEALVLKFTYAHVAAGDPQRGLSLALFRRIFGENQAPENGQELDRTVRPPVITAAAEQAAASAEAALWQRFWQFVDDPRLAGEYGVRIAQVEAPGVPLSAGQIWEVSLDAAGGLNLRKLAQTGG